MELTLEQQNAIARLYENESLTENLDDQSARALLEWAQGQIVANTDYALVRAAVSAANSSGEQGAQALVTTASTFLAQELETRAADVSRVNEPPASVPTANTMAPTTAPGSDELTNSPTGMTASRLQASASAAPDRILTATASANLGIQDSPAPLSKTKPKKSRRSKRKKKK